MNDDYNHDHIIYVNRPELDTKNKAVGVPGTFALIIFCTVLYFLSNAWAALEDWQLYESPLRYMLGFYHYLIYEPIMFGKRINEFFLVHQITPFSNLNSVIRWLIVVAYYFGALPWVYFSYQKILRHFKLLKFKLIFPAFPAIVVGLFYLANWLFYTQ